MEFSWIHVSDFHFTEADSYDRNVVLRALVEELRRRYQQGFRPNVIFATGDIASRGQPREYAPATAFFDNLLKAVELTRKDLFVVPGNHDVNRGAARGLNRTISSEQESVDYFSQEHPQYHFAKFAAFQDWFNRYFQGIRTCPDRSTCHTPEIIEIKGIRVGVLPINSALFAVDDNDHGKLWIGRRNLDDALDTLKSLGLQTFSVALLHHPLEWLHDAERSNIKAKLQSYADFILRGHLHETDIETVVNTTGQALHLSAGACYQTRNWPNRTLICTVDLEKGEATIVPLRYEDSPHEVWTLDTSVFPYLPQFHGTYAVPRLRTRSGSIPDPTPSTIEKKLPVKVDRSAKPPVTSDVKPIEARNGIRIFYSYSHADEALSNELETHLSLLKRQGLVESWHDRKITAGDDWKDQIDHHIEQADVILLLVSSNFLASDYCWDIEMRRALVLHDKGKARVIPIIIRPVDWKGAPFAKLQALPKDAKPVTSWSDRDEAWTDVARGLRRVVEETRRNTSIIVPSLPVVSLDQKTYELAEVFKKSGFPIVTFVEPPIFYGLKQALKETGRGIVIQGPSGSGKTTALETAIQRIKQEKGPAAQFKLKKMSARNPSECEQLRNIREWHKGIVSVDDFHRLDEKMKTYLVDYLKELADLDDAKRKLVIIGIPRTSKGLVKLSFDVATRISTFKLGQVEDSAIEELIKMGEQALNIEFERKSEIIQAAAGSLNIAQMLCFYLLEDAKVERTQLTKRVIKSSLQEAIQRGMDQVAPKFQELVVDFASLGGHRDHTPIHLLRELTQAHEGFLPLHVLSQRRVDLSIGIKRFLAEDQISGLYAKNPDADTHIWYDQTNATLAVCDPQFTFYLRQLSDRRLLSISGKSETTRRSSVLIGASKADLLLVDRLRIHLSPVMRSSHLDIWDDSRMSASTRWSEDLKSAVDSAAAVVLFVSADFLASDMIDTGVLPQLLMQAQADGAKIMLVTARASNLHLIQSLQGFARINESNVPLDLLPSGEQENLLAKAATMIDSALKDAMDA